MRLAWKKLLARPLAASLLAAATVSLAMAQSVQAPLELTGTLAKVRRQGSITLGYRDAAIPFSYLSARGEPIGYSVDLCKLLVDAMSEALGRNIAIEWRPVSAESRIEAVTSGRIDMECGSTTNNLERRQQVRFSPTIFVSGTKLLVPRKSPIKSFRDLDGRRVAVTAGTTNESAVRRLISKFGISPRLVVLPDHATAFSLLTRGEVDTFATDEVLLYGLLAQHKLQGSYLVTGEFLSYDPYGIVFRKDDPQLANFVEETFRALAADREIERRYIRWFLKALPSGVSLNLPMSPQLESIFETMGAPRE